MKIVKFVILPKQTIFFGFKIRTDVKIKIILISFAEIA